jgi:hypothetical protein
MTAISKQTAMDIALAYREVESAERLLEDVREATKRTGPPTDIRDAFGRTQHGLQLGVPSGDGSTRLFGVPYGLAMPIIEAHAAQHRAVILALTEKARSEIMECDPQHKSSESRNSPGPADVKSSQPQAPQGKTPIDGAVL